jgi:S-layer homology domain.
MKKVLLVILTILSLIMSTVVYADFSDVSQNDSYYNAANRLKSLGIMNGVSNENFDPWGNVTREQFARIIIKATGLKDTAAGMQGTSAYSDVDPNSEISGYINLAISKGFLSGAIDGYFHPEANVSYAQVCTATVRALGYTDKDVPGIWPKNYIEKASDLEITTGISFGNNDAVQRWAMAKIIDKLLDTNIKKQSQSEPDKSLADAAELFTECTILDNSKTSDKLADNQVQTDKGIFYYDNSAMELQLGNTYRLDIKDNETIKTAYGAQKTLEGISVDGSVGNKVSYRDEKGITQYKTLPDKTTYYYHGSKIAYDNIASILQTRCSIVFAYNDDNSGYEYAVIYDPIYSDPEVARGYDPSSRQIGDISIRGDATVIREGKVIDAQSIREKDVVYKVSDIWDKYSYILVVDDKVGGKIDDVFPDRVTPKYVRVDGKDYYFSNDIDINKLSVRPGALEEDDNVVMLLGHDGKVVDIDYLGSDENSNYAFVINYAMDLKGTVRGTIDAKYTVKLLTADGITSTFYCNNDPTNFKGLLVKLKWDDSKHVTLERIAYDYPKGVVINKADKAINDTYASTNIKIFNFISNDDGVDAAVELIDYNDLPQGTLADNKVLFISKTGVFDDVNVMLTNDIKGEVFKTAVVQSVSVGSDGTSTYFSYKLLSEGDEYIYNEGLLGLHVGDVVKIKLSGNKVKELDGPINYVFKTTQIDAFDSRRVKIKDKIFWLNSNIAVYFWNYDGKIEEKSLGEVNLDDLYGSITLYSAYPLEEGGKVDMILVKQ